MQIALFATLNRPHALAVARQVIAWLRDRGHAVRLDPALGRAVNCPECRVPDEQVMDGSDIAISIGGDGTMLGTVRQAAPHRVPVLGVNAGALGFLTELAPEEIIDYLPRVVSGEYAIEARMMIFARALRGEEAVAEMVALNDVVIRQGAQGRLIRMLPFVSGHSLGQIGADGLIISTPSGSTAYGLAAGGPIVHPVTQVIVLVPICPHSLTFRPMVIPASDLVEVVCEGNTHNDEMLVIADGQEPVIVQSGDRIVIRPAAEQALLVKFGISSFYDRLREKLQWGGK